MEDLKAALMAAGYESFTPAFDGEVRFLDDIHSRYVLAWEVRDDYNNLIHQEIKYCLDKPGDLLLPVGDSAAYPESLVEKIVKAREAARKKITAAILMPVGQGVALVEEREPDEEFIPQPEHVVNAWDELGLVLTEKGSPVPNADNALRILEGVTAFSKRIWLDEFTNNIMTTFGTKEEREWTDNDTRALWIEYQRTMGLARIGQDTVLSGVMAYAYTNRRHPVKEWLAKVEWDRVPRIDTFLRDYMSAENTEFNRSASANFFVAMIARVFAPGCKVDNMVVLEGGQGVRKSSALKALCGKWFTECNEPISNGSNKDFYAILQGKMLVEIAELDSFSRADILRIKAIITTATDRYRPAYGRIAQNFPRTSVFVGTTNEEEYLADPTGGRRFWPVRIGSIRLDDIARDRDQLFAEALVRYKAKPIWWEMPQAEALVVQESRRKSDAWETLIEDWFRAQAVAPVMVPPMLTSQLLLADAIKLDPGHMDQRSMNRMAYVMKVLGYKNKVSWDKETKGTKRVWIKG